MMALWETALIRCKVLMDGRTLVSNDATSKRLYSASDVLNNGWNDNEPVINEDELVLKSSVLTLKLNKHCASTRSHFFLPLPFFPTRYCSTVKIKSLFWGVQICESGFKSCSTKPRPQRSRSQNQRTGIVGGPSARTLGAGPVTWSPCGQAFQ